MLYYFLLLVNMAESYQIYLNSKYATSYFNNTYKFSLNTLEIDEGH